MRGSVRDIALSYDTGARVNEVAHALVRHISKTAAAPGADTTHQQGPLTLTVRSDDDETAVLLDPAAPVGVSGVQSGWEVRVVREFVAAEGAPRLLEAVGAVEVLNGSRRGDRFSLVPGINTVGRGRGNRIRVRDRSVSRRHCVIDVGDRAVVRDLVSVNGVIVDDEVRSTVEVPAPGACVVRIGEVCLRIEVRSSVSGGAPVPSARAAITPHARPPRVVPPFPAAERGLPKPPETAPHPRLPVVAMIAPATLGLAMWLTTGSATSLVFVLLSPALVVASWLDERLRGRRRARRDAEAFTRSLDRERRELAEAREREVAVRSAESPSIRECLDAVHERNRVLWARRPEHGAFLAVRFGTGRLASRTRLTVPDGGSSEDRERLRDLAEDFTHAEPVPVVEHLPRVGSVAICGAGDSAHGLARAVVLQIVALHAPAEVQLVCFADSATSAAWAWLSWLPHVDAASSPLGVAHLADDARGGAALASALESLVAERRSGPGERSVRSRLDPDSAELRDVDGTVNRVPDTPAVIVLVLSDAHAERARLVGLAESGPDVGVHLIWVARDSSAIPAACRTYAECDSEGARVHAVRTGTSVPLLDVESVDHDAAHRAARRLAPVVDTGTRSAEDRGLPDAVELRDLHEVDLTGGPDAIRLGWHATGSARAGWRQGERREPAALAATVGQGTDGPLRIDLRADGPHALVGGTTGSGKSEFLQTWIMSLAASLSPEQVTFLLFDFKGGAAFADCAALPHAVGLVTDLSAHLAQRAITSLRAELRYREALLAEHGAKDLLTLERQADVAAPPALVIVIDEFAALANEVPEFVDGVVDIAQRGRSLGLHLIMATQRPAGVITENLRANTRIRIALRMADEGESRDVIGTPEASRIAAATPGRGVIRFGTETVRPFQTGRLGASRRSRAPGADVAIRDLAFGVPHREALAPGDPADEATGIEDGPTDLARVGRAIRAAAEDAHLSAPRRPWLNPLPDDLALDSVRSVAPGAPAHVIAVGLSDRPDLQRQPLLAIDFAEVGHVAIVGASGTGKTSALVTIAAEVSAASTASHPIEVYGIDAAGGALGCLTELPTVGAVAPVSDAELVSRIFDRLHELLEGKPTGCVRAVLLLDGLASFREATESLPGPASTGFRLSEVMSRGRSAGVHVVVTTDRPSAISSALAAGIQLRYALRLANEGDSALLGLRTGLLDEAPPGRGVVLGTQEEFQFAVVATRSSGESLPRALARRAADLEASGAPPVPRLRKAPHRIALAELPVAHAELPVIGIETGQFAPATMLAAGVGIITGPPASGTSTALQTCLSAWIRWSSKLGAKADTVLLAFGRSVLRDRGEWGRAATREEEVADLVETLITEVGERQTGSYASRTLIVVERPTDCEDDRVLSRLAVLARTVKRSDAVMLIEYEDGSVPHVLSAAVRHPRWGISLRPDPLDGSGPFRERFPRRDRRDDPVGRGLMMSDGTVTEIQVALADASASGGAA